MRINPRLIFSAAAACMLLSLVACSGKNAAPAGGSAATPNPADNKVVIISPHDESIKHELAPAFQAWYAKKYPGKPVPTVEWQDRGGSVEDNKYLISSYTALGAHADEGVGIDLAFGGGVPAQAQLKEKGVTVAVELEPAVFSSIPKDLAGVSLIDADKKWFGVVLSSFGIVYNKSGLRAKGLPEPQTWSDLAAPAYANALVLADPAKSGSARVCYEVMLQRYGWVEGWGTIMQLAGNTREFANGSAKVPQEVAQGSALAGVCVDYQALGQIAQAGNDTAGFVSPVNATAITPDPISMLRGAPHAELAKAFITFTLSSECQSLFGLRSGVPGGPKANLFRMPILPAYYMEKRAPGASLFEASPYASASTFNIDEKLSDARAPLLGPLFAAAFLNNKQQLQAAWQAAAAHMKDNPALLAQFRAVPFGEAQALEIAKKYVNSPREAIQMDREWQTAFRKRYEDIVAAAK